MDVDSAQPPAPAPPSPPPPAVYVPYVHVEYYIQPAESYSDKAALVQEANRRVPEIVAARRRKEAEEVVAAAAAAHAAAAASAPVPKTVAPAPSAVAPLTVPVASPVGPPASAPGPPPTADAATAALLPFHGAPSLPTPAKPARKPKPPIRPTVAGSRATRHFLPWGVPAPRMLEFKSDFALDGECVPPFSPSSPCPSLAWRAR